MRVENAEMGGDDNASGVELRGRWEMLLLLVVGSSGRKPPVGASFLLR